MLTIKQYINIRKFLLLGLLHILTNCNQSICMEKQTTKDTVILDKTDKTMILNILALGHTFVENSKHMLRYLKKIQKHATSGMPVNAPITDYSTTPFQLPEEQPIVLSFKDAALQYTIKNNVPATPFFIYHEDHKKNTKTRLANFVKEIRHNQLDKTKDFNINKAYKLIGKDTLYYFNDSKYIKIFDQESFSPDAFIFFLKNKELFKEGNKPFKKEFSDPVEKEIYHYFAFLYAFERLLDFECQIPLYNLVKADGHLIYDISKNASKDRIYFQQFIPHLFILHPAVAEYLNYTGTEKPFSVEKVKVIKTFLNNHLEKIAYFDSLHNALFEMCFIMHKTSAVPTTLSELIPCIESKLNLAEKATTFIDPLHSLYEHFYTEKAVKSISFWGPRLLQKDHYLPEHILATHISPELIKQKEVEAQEKKIKEQELLIATENAKKSLLEELGYTNKQYPSKKHPTNNKKHNSQHKINNQKDKIVHTAKKNTNAIQHKAPAKKQTIKSEKITVIPVNQQIDSAPIMPTIIQQDTQEQEPYLLFNKKYFQRLSNTENKELYDHYHGIPGTMIHDIIATGTTIPLPTDPTGKSTVFFEVAAVKTVLTKYLYYLAVVITDKNGAIFHVGLHKENNAIKTVGALASKKISYFKTLIDWPPMEVNNTVSNKKNKIEKIEHVSEPNYVPKNALIVPLTDFNTQFSCIEKPSSYADTQTFILPNDEELIFLHTNKI